MIRKSYSGQYFLALPRNRFTRRFGLLARIGTKPIVRVNLWRIRP